MTSFYVQIDTFACYIQHERNDSLEHMYLFCAMLQFSYFYCVLFRIIYLSFSRRNLCNWSVVSYAGVFFSLTVFRSDFLGFCGLFFRSALFCVLLRASL